MVGIAAQLDTIAASANGFRRLRIMGYLLGFGVGCNSGKGCLGEFRLSGNVSHNHMLSSFGKFEAM